MNNCGKLRFWYYFVDGKVLVENVRREKFWWIFWTVYAIFFKNRAFPPRISTKNLPSEHCTWSLKDFVFVLSFSVCVSFCWSLPSPDDKLSKKWLYGLKHHIVDINGDVTMRDNSVVTTEQGKIELLSHAKCVELLLVQVQLLWLVS